MTSLFEKLKQLQLKRSDYAIFGSGPLIIRGIIAADNDLDVICRGVAWEQVKALRKPRRDNQYGVDIVELFGGQLTFGTAWGIGEVDVDQLIDDAEIIDDMPFVKLEHVVRYKRSRLNTKDKTHLRLLERANGS